MREWQRRQQTALPPASAAPPLGRGYWLAATVIVLALLPLLGGKTGIISNYGFLQLSLMIVYAIAVLGLILLTGFNGQISLGPRRLLRGRRPMWPRS